MYTVVKIALFNWFPNRIYIHKQLDLGRHSQWNNAVFSSTCSFSRLFSGSRGKTFGSKGTSNYCLQIISISPLFLDNFSLLSCIRTQWNKPILATFFLFNSTKFAPLSQSLEEKFSEKRSFVLTATWAESAMETRLTPMFTNKFSRFISVHFLLKNQINALSQRRYTFDPFFLDAVLTFIEEN